MCKPADLPFEGSPNADAPREAAAAAGERFVDVAVIGAGLQGVTVAAFLNKSGIHDFLVVDEGEPGAVGGTWKDHNYPNCGTDTEVCVYYPSFLPRPKTATQFGDRDEILNHFREVARTHVGSKRFMWETRLGACRFDGSVWRLENTDGKHVLTARFVLPCIFSISCKHPIYPNIANRNTYTGEAIHSSRLDRSLDRFRDKKVVIIGCGASTLQIAPAVASVSTTCHVLRRTMPYIKERPRSAMPDNDFGFSFWRTLYEIRNDIITLFDSWRRLEVIVRLWFHLTNYVFSGRPAEARPPLSQPVQCTRRCYDYCGFMKNVRAGKITIRDVSKNSITSFLERGVVLADGTEVDADVVIYATGYNVTGGGSEVEWTVAGEPHTLRNTSPNVFMPLSGCPLYCVPPRAAEQAMPYFVRSYRTYMAEGATGSLAFYPNAPRFYKSDSILYSPSCHSGRYTGGRDPNPNSLTYGVDFSDILGIPIPRFFFLLYSWGQRALHVGGPGAIAALLKRSGDLPDGWDSSPEKRVSESRKSEFHTSRTSQSRTSESRTSEVVRKSVGWMHGCRPQRDDYFAVPLGGTPMRYLTECLAWPILYTISTLTGAEFTH